MSQEEWDALSGVIEVNWDAATGTIDEASLTTVDEKQILAGVAVVGFDKFMKSVEDSAGSFFNHVTCRHVNPTGTVEWWRDIYTYDVLLDVLNAIGNGAAGIAKIGISEYGKMIAHVTYKGENWLIFLNGKAHGNAVQDSIYRVAPGRKGMEAADRIVGQYKLIPKKEFSNYVRSGAKCYHAHISERVTVQAQAPATAPKVTVLPADQAVLYSSTSLMLAWGAGMAYQAQPMYPPTTGQWPVNQQLPILMTTVPTVMNGELIYIQVETQYIECDRTCQLMFYGGGALLIVVGYVLVPAAGTVASFATVAEAVAAGSTAFVPVMRLATQ
ncbi:hypothetical protein KBC79_02310 [Candidatus Woesebacteria bacterium]|nr:hypothetical protein [Candidatus Woesebacteria bacterium]